MHGGRSYRTLRPHTKNNLDALAECGIEEKT